MHPISSGVYRVGASMRVDLEYMDLEYTELVLTAEHPLQHTWNELKEAILALKEDTKLV